MQTSISFPFRNYRSFPSFRRSTNSKQRMQMQARASLAAAERFGVLSVERTHYATTTYLKRRTYKRVECARGWDFVAQTKH